MANSLNSHRFSWQAMLLVLLLLANPSLMAAPGDFDLLSVRQLLTQCLNENESLMASANGCDLYISGYIAAIQQFDLNDQFCSGDAVLNISDIRREFVEWAIYHSEQYDSAASSALQQTLSTMYPCQDSP